jgi:hypothetical protein
LRIDDAHEGGYNVITDRGVLRAQIQQRYRHWDGMLLNVNYIEGARLLGSWPTLSHESLTLAPANPHNAPRNGIGTSRPIFADS